MDNIELIPKNVNDKIISIIRSCKTVEQLKAAKNYVNLVEKKYIVTLWSQYNKWRLYCLTAFIRGIIQGRIFEIGKE